MRTRKMNTKKLLFSFVMLVSFVFLASAVSAQGNLAEINSVTIDGIDSSDEPAIIVGDVLLVGVEFTPLENLSDVSIRAEIEGDSRVVRAERTGLVVEDGHRVYQTLRVEVPFDLENKLSSYAWLTIKVSGQGYQTEESYRVRLHREPYRVDVLPVIVPQSVEAGELFPVDVVLRNKGYNDVRHLYVTAKIPALGIEESGFFGDLAAINLDNDHPDTVNRRIFLRLDSDTNPGNYELEITVEGRNIQTTKTARVSVENPFPEGNVIVSDGEILLANPTNKLVVYRLVTESGSDLSVSLSETLVSVPAGSSRTVYVDAESDVIGTHEYSVSVYAADNSLVEKINFSKNVRGTQTSLASPLFVLTIILAIIFVVLLVVLIVLVGKKPKQTEEFGESYY